MAGTDTSRKTPFTINDLKSSTPSPRGKKTSSRVPSATAPVNDDESETESSEDSGIDTEQGSDEELTEHDEVGMGARFEKGRVGEAKKLHPMFDTIHDWMISYRPGRKMVPSEQDIERA